MSRIWLAAWLSAATVACGPSTPPSTTPTPPQTDGQTPTPDGKADGTPAAVTPQLPDPSTPGAVQFACAFSDGWVAALPAHLVGPDEDDYLMQALIGLTEEPAFWANEKEYAKYKPYAAKPCAADTQAIELPPGDYVMYIGRANQFSRTGYKNNGRIEPITVAPGQTVARKFTLEHLDRDMPCISCPFLLVLRDGAWEELGQILVDRYAMSRAGTDVRRAVADVVDGMVLVRLAEREPEVSFVDAIEVRHAGTRLTPVTTPAALHAIDESFYSMSQGQSVTARFRAPAATPTNGQIEIEIAVSGYYELDR